MVYALVEKAVDSIWEMFDVIRVYCYFNLLRWWFVNHTCLENVQLIFAERHNRIPNWQ